jgi:hypothetical protein
MRQLTVEIDWTSRQCVWFWPPVYHGPTGAIWLESLWMMTFLALAHHHGGLMLHGAGLLSAASPCGVLVAGPSGAGKSTLSRRLGGRCVQDDTCIVTPERDGWRLWYQNGFRVGPWPQAVPASATVALRHVFFLGPERTRTVRQPLGAADAYGHLLQQTYFAGPLLAGAVSDALLRLITEVPTYTLSHCLDDTTVLVEQALFADDAADQGCP